MKTVVAWLIACASMAHTPQLFAQESQALHGQAAAPAPQGDAAVTSQIAAGPAGPEPAPPAGSSADQPDPTGKAASSAEASVGASSIAAPETGQKADDQVQPYQEMPEPDAAEPAGDEIEETALPPAGALPAPDESHLGIERLERKLQQVETERSNSSRMLPWLTVGLGGVASVGGTVAGSAYAFGCEDGECESPSWIGMVVATGTLVATLGVIWVVHADADVRELDSERYHLQQEIERLRMTSRQRVGDVAASAPAISWRFAWR